MMAMSKQNRGRPLASTQGLSAPNGISYHPFFNAMNNLKETNNLASNNPINLFQCTTGSLMWIGQISRTLQHLFLAIAITMCYNFPLQTNKQKTAGDSLCYFI